MAELYLRDLNVFVARDILTWFKKEGREDLLKAWNTGKDIKIGTTFEDLNNMEVV